MSAPRPTALIADDEPLLRTALVRLLASAWPELEIVAQARNGREAVEQFEALQPQVCFLDVHMPGLSGVDAARLIERRAHIVFVTAFNEYAVQAFEHGAIEEGTLTAFNIAIEQFHNAVADRKALLLSMPQNLQRAATQFRAAGA